MATVVGAQERLLLPEDGRVHDGLRGEVELSVRVRAEDLAEVGLTETVTGFVKGDGFDVEDREEAPTVGPDRECGEDAVSRGSFRSSSLGTFVFDGPAGRLEALYRPGSDDPRRVALLCHPHPLDGGSMHNKVVYRAAKALESVGYAVLRFNFRGVGASQGAFADGIGEADDVRAALDWLAREHAGKPIVLAGFSFGNVVGLPVGAMDERVSHLVGLGTPTDRFPFDRLADVGKPKLFVQGDRDPFGPVERLRSGLARVAQPWTLVVVDDADHFYTGRLEALQAVLVDYFGRPAGEKTSSVAS